MFKPFAIAALTVSIFGCATGDIAMIVSDKSTAELLGEKQPEAIMAVKDAIETRPLFHIDLERRESTKEKQLIPVLPEVSTSIEYGQYTALSSAVQFNTKPANSKIDVSSYLVRPQGGKKFILYPIVSAVAKDYSIIGTLEPIESTSKSNSITNTFNLPDGTMYLLVHCAPDFVNPQFFEDIHNNESNILIGGLGALGGALGGALAGVISISGTDNTAPIGYVEIMYAE